MRAPRREGTKCESRNELRCRYKVRDSKQQTLSCSDTIVLSIERRSCQEVLVSGRVRTALPSPPIHSGYHVMRIILTCSIAQTVSSLYRKGTSLIPRLALPWLLRSILCSFPWGDLSLPRLLVCSAIIAITEHVNRISCLNREGFRLFRAPLACLSESPGMMRE